MSSSPDRTSAHTYLYILEVIGQTLYMRYFAMKKMTNLKMKQHKSNIAVIN